MANQTILHDLGKVYYCCTSSGGDQDFLDFLQKRLKRLTTGPVVDIIKPFLQEI